MKRLASKVNSTGDKLQYNTVYWNKQQSCMPEIHL